MSRKHDCDENDDGERHHEKNKTITESDYQYARRYIGEQLHQQSNVAYYRCRQAIPVYRDRVYSSGRWVYDTASWIWGETMEYIYVSQEALYTLIQFDHK